MEVVEPLVAGAAGHYGHGGNEPCRRPPRARIQRTEPENSIALSVTDWCLSIIRSTA